MINRIRDIRRDRGLTLADVAQACDPPTTAQTIGRLETGMRNLSLKWMERIGAALGVEPQTLVAPAAAEPVHVVARLTPEGAQALAQPRVATAPVGIAGGAGMVLAIEATIGEYRLGDQLWLRRIDPADAPRALNRDVLVPRRGGRFAFGRLIDRQAGPSGDRFGILPPGMGQRQIVVDAPLWLALADVLVRRL